MTGLVQSGKVRKKTMVFSKVRESQVREKYSLKFESQGITNLQCFSFYGFSSFEAFLSFDYENKN